MLSDDFIAGAVAEAGVGPDPDARLKQSVGFAANIEPDTAARAINVGVKTGLPEEFVNENLDMLESESKKNDFNPVAFRNSNPVVANWIAKKANNAALALPEAGKLGKLEPYFTLPADQWPLNPDQIDAMAERAAVKATEGYAKQAPAPSAPTPEGFQYSYAESQAGTSPITPELQTKEQAKEQFIKDIRAEEAYVSGAGKVGFFEESSKTFRENPAVLIPFVSGANAAARSLGLFQAAKRMEAGTATPDDMDTLVRFGRVNAAGNRRGEAVMGMVSDIVVNLPAFAIELGATEGIYQAAKLPTLVAGKAMVNKIIGSAVSKAFTNRAVRLGGWVAGSAVQSSVAGAARTVAGVADRMLPTGSVVRDGSGQASYLIDKGTGETFPVALAKAWADTFVEGASERSGILFESMDKRVQKVLFDKWASKTPGASASLFKKALKAGHVQGIIGESLEEEIGKAMKAGMGVEDYKITTPEELLAQLIAFGAPGGAHAAISHIGSKEASTDAIARAEHFKAIGDQLKNLDMNQKSKPATTELVQNMVDAGPNGDVYIPKEVFDTFYQAQKDPSGNPIDPRAVVQEMLGNDKAYTEAEATGHIAVPAAIYHMTIGQSDHSDFFAEHVKIGDPSALSGAEGKANNENRDQLKADMQAQEEAAKLETAAEGGDPMAVFKRDYAAKIQEIGKSAEKIGTSSTYAKDAAEYFVAALSGIAQAAGITPAQALEEMPYEQKAAETIEHPLEPIINPVPLQQAQQNESLDNIKDSDKMESDLGPIIPDSEVEHLKAANLKLEQDLGEERRLRRTSDISGVRNKIAFEEDESLGWPIVAAFDMDGLKRINDFLGHVYGDKVLRVLGNRVVKAQGDGESVRFYHRSGDEFAVRFKDEAGAKELLTELQDELDRTLVEFEIPDGRKYNLEGIGVSFGIGEDYETADTAAIRNKGERLKLGKREESRGGFFDLLRRAFKIKSGPPKRLKSVPTGIDRLGKGGNAQDEGVDTSSPADQSGGNGQGGKSLDRILAEQSQSRSIPLSGYPELNERNLGPSALLREAARVYANRAGFPKRQPSTWAQLHEEVPLKLANAFIDAKHEPNNSIVRKSYEALKRETLAQYILIKQLGIKFLPIIGADPYSDGPWQAILDFHKNNRLYYFPTIAEGSTEGRFGSVEAIQDNPLLEPSGEFLTDENGKVHELVYNDIFRIVHDIFGHIKEGNGFGPRGEENAWQSHVRMYSDEAIPAMTTETRGQNSFVNFSPQLLSDLPQKTKDEVSARGEHKIEDAPANMTIGQWNQKHKPQTIYADQKVTLLPEFAWTEGLTPDDESNTYFQNDDEHQALDEVFYSQMRELINAKMGPTATVDQIKGMIKEIKAEEREWSGIDDFLNEKAGNEKISKETLNQYLEANQVALEEKILTDSEIDESELEERVDEAVREEADARFEQAMFNGDASPYYTKELEDDEGKAYWVVRYDNETVGGEQHATEEEAQKSADDYNDSASEEVQREIYNDIDRGDIEARIREEMGESDEDKVKFKGYGGNEPGGTNYVERLITLSPKSQTDLNNQIDTLKFEWDVAHERARKYLDDAIVKSKVETYAELPEEIQQHYIKLVSERDALESKRDALKLQKRKPYSSSHWDDHKDVIVHVRTDDRQFPVEVFKDTDPALYAKLTKEGKSSARVLDIKEIQSDLHQEGRESGYQTKDGKRISMEELDTAKEAVKSRYEAAYNAMKEVDFLGFDSAMRAFDAVAREPEWSDKWDVPPNNPSYGPINDWRTAERAYLALRKQYESANNAIVDTPFKKTWHELAMKRMIRLAAEEGYDAVFWSNGAMNAGRYPDAMRQIVDSFDWTKPDSLGERKFGAYKGTTNKFRCTLNSDGIIIEGGPSEYHDKPLSEVIGKEMASQVMQSTDYGQIEGKDFTVGGEGMKGFYDKMLPIAAGKLIKKHGGKVVTVPSVSFKDVAAASPAITVSRMDNGVFYADGSVGVYTPNQEQAYRMADKENRVEGREFTTFNSRKEAKAWLDENKPKGKGWVVGKTDFVVNAWAVYDENGNLLTKKEPTPIQIDKSKFPMVQGFAITPELREFSTRKGFPLFQADGVDPRGQISPKGIGRLVEMFNRADRSTPIHEPAHYFMDLINHLASKDGAKPEIIQLNDRIVAWLGAKSYAELSRSQKERFAEAAEAYMFEGKSPNEEMHSVFVHFKMWFSDIYGAISKFLKLDPEIRDIFDTMMTGQSAAIRAERQSALTPMFKDAASSGMTEQQFAAYQKATAEARQYSEEKITSQLLRKFRRAEKKAANRQRAEIEKQVRAEVDKLPVYQAIDSMTIRQTTEAPLKISREDVPVDMLKDIPKDVMATENAFHPEVVAEIIGYESGAQLLKDLSFAQPKEALIKEMTDKRMIEEHPDMLTDGTLPAEAISQVHNDKQAYKLRLELEHLAAHNMPVLKAGIRHVARRPPAMKDVTDNAISIIASKPVNQIKPYIYQKAEIRWAREAGKLFAQGKLGEAFDAKLKELLNHELFRQAELAQKKIKKSLELFKKIADTDSKIAKSREMNMVNAARAVLAEFGIGNKNKTSDQYLEPIKQYDPDQYVTLKDMVDSVTEGAADYKLLPFDRLVEMSDAVEALWDLARRDKNIEVNGKLVDRQIAIANLTIGIAEVSSPKAIEEYRGTATTWDKVKMSLLGMKAALRRVESWSDAMDKGAIDGAFHTFVWFPIKDGANKYRVKKVDHLTKLKSYIETLQPTLTFEPILADELKGSLLSKFKSKVELLGAMMHRGNPSNFSKLLRGYGWAEYDENGKLDTSKWDAFETRMIEEGVLTKVDYDFLQSVWDLLEEIKPDAQKAHKAMYGFTFNEVTAEPFSNAFGTYRGGYYPAVADPFVNPDAQIRTEKDQLEKQNNSFMFPTAGRGFTKTRKEGYARPLMLDLRAIPSHIDKVLRFIYIEPHVKDVGRIMWDKDFRNSLNEYDPTIVGDMLVPWLQRSAQQITETPMKGNGGKAIDWFFRHLRKTAGMQIMVGNVLNAMQQFTGLSIAALKVEPKHLRSALWLYTRNSKGMTDDMISKSEYMATKVDASSIEIMNSINEIILDKGPYETAKAFAMRHGYFLQRAFQNVVDTITWTGAYNQAIENGASEQDAVRASDEAVRLTQGSFDPEDISRFEVGTPFVKAFTMFYSYFNMNANTLGTEFQKVARDMGLKKGKGRALYVYTMGLMIPAVLSALLIASMSKKGIDEDDDGNYLDDLMRIFFAGQFDTASSMFPIIGPAIRSGVNGYNSKWYDDKMTSSPAVNILETGARVVTGSTFKGSTKNMIRDLLTTIGAFTGLPLGPLAKPLGYAAEVSQGKVRPKGKLDYARGLVTGK